MKSKKRKFHGTKAKALSYLRDVKNAERQKRRKPILKGGDLFMNQNDRLAYYKALKLQNIALSEAQEADYIAICKERGESSTAAMPVGGAKYEEAKRTL